jgi:hypothetical protein
MLLGVDVGGTFTDAIVFDGAKLRTAKSPSTPADPSRGVLAAVEAALGAAGAGASDIDVFAHGMTVGTNALLTESGARTALIATEGFTDVLEVARQNRPDLYRLCTPKPAPLVPLELRFGANGRTGPRGEIDPLARGEANRLAAAVRDSGAEAVAICLLFSYLDPSQERALAEHLRSAIADLHVSASCEVLPQFREYERASTTVIDAYLSPLLGRYLGRLARSARDLGLPEPLIMKSSGGVAPTAEAAQAGACCRDPPAAPWARRSSRGCRVTATPSGSTWAVRHATCAWSRTGACAAPTRGRSPAGSSSCRWSTFIPWGPAAARSDGATTAARCASGPIRQERSPGPPATDGAGPIRRSPTRTSCSATWTPHRRSRAGWSST